MYREQVRMATGFSSESIHGWRSIIISENDFFRNEGETSSLDKMAQTCLSLLFTNSILQCIFSYTTTVIILYRAVIVVQLLSGFLDLILVDVYLWEGVFPCIIPGNSQMQQHAQELNSNAICPETATDSPGQGFHPVRLPSTPYSRCQSQAPGS